MILNVGYVKSMRTPWLMAVDEVKRGCRDCYQTLLCSHKEDDLSPNFLAPPYLIPLGIKRETKKNLRKTLDKVGRIVKSPKVPVTSSRYNFSHT